MTKQQLFKLLKRRIEVSRFEAHVRRDLLKRLGKLHNQVKNRVYDVDLDNIGKRELNRLIKEIERLSTERHAELVALMSAYSAELIDDEADFIRREMDWQAPDKTPDFMPLVLGATINEWLSKQARDYAHSVKMAVRTGGTLDHLARWLGNQTKSFTVTWANATSQQTQRNLAEKSKGFSEYQHNSLLDSKTSDMCLVRHLKRWTADKAPIDHDLKYEEPPLHRHCRSFMTFEFDFYDSSEIDGVTADDWLDSMSDKEQAEVLGVGKAQMYRRGDITLRDLLDQSGRPQTLKALQDAKLLPDINAVTSDLLINVKAVEPEITQLLQTIGKNSNATLAGLDYRFKSHKSLKRKITSIVRRRSIKASEVADDIKDVLRYTYLLNEKDFVRQFKQIKNSLEQQGHKAISISNTWRKNSAYKGINTTFNINGQSYELQFHTADSFALKNGKLHELYEQFRADDVSDSVKRRLNEQMITLSDQIKQPAKIGTIRNQKGK